MEGRPYMPWVLTWFSAVVDLRVCSSCNWNCKLASLQKAISESLPIAFFFHQIDDCHCSTFSPVAFLPPFPRFCFKKQAAYLHFLHSRNKTFPIPSHTHTHTHTISSKGRSVSLIEHYLILRGFYLSLLFVPTFLDTKILVFTRIVQIYGIQAPWDSLNLKLPWCGIEEIAKKHAVAFFLPFRAAFLIRQMRDRFCFQHS